MKSRRHAFDNIEVKYSDVAPKFTRVEDLTKWYTRQKRIMLGLPIKRWSSTIPYGYEIDPTNIQSLLPVQNYLVALLEAKKFLETCTTRDVAKWLAAITGREISHTGLIKLIHTRCPDQRVLTMSQTEREELCPEI